MPRPRSIPIQLDRPRNLRFGWKANAAFERETGLSVLELMTDISSQVDNKGVRIKVGHLMALLWAGLIHEDETLTIDALAEILDEIGDGVMPTLQSFQEKLIEAVTAGLGGEEAKKKLKEISPDESPAGSPKEMTV